MVSPFSGMLRAVLGLVHALRLWLPALLLVAAGCASKPQQVELEHDVLLLAPDDYQVAFDAAIEAARREGMPAALRDRRGGLIITEYRTAASLLEPWATHGEPFRQTMENTVAEQRRRARFEFVPAGAMPRLQDEGTRGLDLGPPVDLTAAEGTLEMHVRVFLERAYEPGQRRSTWTSRKPSRAEIVVPGEPETVLPAIFWTPVSRDRDAERRMIEAVNAAIDKAAAETASG